MWSRWKRRVGLLAVIALWLCCAAGCAETDPTVSGGESSDAGSDVADETDTTSEDPCEGVTCGGHGTCVERTGQEIDCVCDAGYRPEGQTCVEVDPNAPCDGVDCSGHGTCTVDGDDPVCECDSGYESGGALTCVEINPCEGQTCSGHGTCVVNGSVASCQCDSQYESSGLECTPEDKDGDGEPFTTDCDDDDPEINPSATEVCDGVDNNCDGQVDEGTVCGIWVLEPRASEWDAYPLDPAGSGNAPSATIRAAWDIESEDRAYVLTDAGYHVLRINSLSWQAAQPLSDLGPNLQDAAGPGTTANAVPADHAGGDGTTESVTIAGMRSNDKIVWAFNYDIASRTHSPNNESLYNEAHVWDDANAPEPSELRASWLDVDNSRGWMDADPSNYCDTNTTVSDPYAGRITSGRYYLAELGTCFKFTHNMPLSQSPIAQFGNPPPFDEVGAAFWHQGALYMLRGN